MPLLFFFYDYIWSPLRNSLPHFWSFELFEYIESVWYLALHLLFYFFFFFRKKEFALRCINDFSSWNFNFPRKMQTIRMQTSISNMWPLQKHSVRNIADSRLLMNLCWLALFSCAKHQVICKMWTMWTMWNVNTIETRELSISYALNEI